MKIKLKTEGLTGDNLTFVEQLNKRFAELPDGMSKEEVSSEVRAALTDFLGEDGKPKFDVAQLAELLGDGEKGIRSILKKQGEAITALKESGAGEKKSLRTVINERWKDIEKVYQRGEGEVRINLRVAQVMTMENVVDDTGIPEDLIESFSVGEFVPKRHPREWIFDIASRTTVANIDQYKTWLEEGDVEGAFAVIDEGELKPLLSTALVRNHSAYKKAAGKYVVTEEVQKFRRNIYTIIQRIIRQQVLRDYANILAVDLMASAASYVSSALDGQYANPTDYHAIAAVAAQIEALDFVPDVLIMNPQDKWRIGMSQDTTGQFYLTIPVTDPSGQTRMMGFMVRTSNKIAVGNFILGESGLWEIEDEALTIRTGYGAEVVKDAVSGNVTDVQPDIDHNRFRVIVETFFHNYIATNNTGSYVYGNYDTIKALVQTAP